MFDIDGTLVRSSTFDEECYLKAAQYSIIHSPKIYVHQFFKEFRRTLVKNGKLLISVKSGDTEEYIENFMESNTKIYFSHFTKPEIEKYFIGGGFRIISIEERSPYPDEINVKRIFAIGEKV